MAISFVSLLGGFAACAVILKWFSGRQLRKIDRLAETEEE
jgi:hypothetical protein